tara:strand:+ start:321 stop:572 length:252 start_codon:yes stop_codon:yes gene_type:complete
MALTEDSVIDSIDVLLDGQIQVRRATRIFRDGVEISKAYHRHVVSPGEDLSLEDPRVATIGAAVHTPEVIAAFKAAQENALPG